MTIKIRWHVPYFPLKENSIGPLNFTTSSRLGTRKLSARLRSLAKMPSWPPPTGPDGENLWLNLGKMVIKPENYGENKPRWCPQQPQRFIFTKFSLQPSPEPSLATFSGTRWTWPGPAPKVPKTFSGIFSATFSGNLLNLTWLCTKACWNILRNLLRNPVEPDLAPHQSLPHLLRNLLRSPVEPYLALRQSLPHLLRNFLRNPVELDPALHQSLLDLLRNLLRNPVEPDLDPHQASQTFSGTFWTFSGTLLNLTRRLHQCTPELFWAEDPISLCCWGKTKVQRYIFSITPGKMMISLTVLTNGSRKKTFFTIRSWKLSNKKGGFTNKHVDWKKNDSFTWFNRHKVDFTFAMDLSNSQILKRGSYLAKLWVIWQQFGFRMNLPSVKRIFKMIDPIRMIIPKSNSNKQLPKSPTALKPPRNRSLCPCWV